MAICIILLSIRLIISAISPFTCLLLLCVPLQAISSQSAAFKCTFGRTRCCIFYVDVICAVISNMDAFKWLGVVIIVVACLGVAPIYFPQWGGMLCPPKKGVTEEDYYYGEYTPLEREQGMHLAASKFVRARNCLPWGCHMMLCRGDSASGACSNLL